MTHTTSTLTQKTIATLAEVKRRTLFFIARTFHTERVEEFDKFVAQIDDKYRKDVSMNDFKEFKKMKSHCRHLELKVEFGVHLFFHGKEIMEWVRGKVTRIPVAEARDLADRCYLTEAFEDMMK